MGLGVYMYAPKDDYKHRLYWRDLYGPEESGIVFVCDRFFTSTGKLYT